MKIGITGGIGSGKSFVCRRLARYGIEVYDCDAAAKRLIRTSPKIRQELTTLIGCDTYINGTLNKAAVAQFLLQSDDHAKAIDAIVHPAVFQDFEESGMTWMESAIMYESGIYRLVDKVIVVTAPLEVRIDRVMQRDHITREKVLQWMQRQLPQEEVRKRAHYEIINDGKADIDAQIAQIPEISEHRNNEISEHRNNETSKQHNKKENNMKQTILAISGKPGLYKLVSRSKNSLIVEALDGTGKRMPAFGTDRITSLADIAMFTETDDVPLMKVLASLRDLEKGKTASVNYKKASPKELHDYFTKVLPEWDQERVHNSDIKKLLQWYDILVTAGITDFEEDLAPTEGENIDDRKAE